MKGTELHVVAQTTSAQLCAIVICINIPDDYQFPEEDIALEMIDNNNGNMCRMNMCRAKGEEWVDM